MQGPLRLAIDRVAIAAAALEPEVDDVALGQAEIPPLDHLGLLARGLIEASREGVDVAGAEEHLAHRAARKPAEHAEAHRHAQALAGQSQLDVADARIVRREGELVVDAIVATDYFARPTRLASPLASPRFAGGRFQAQLPAVTAPDQ